jgi:hypothetical protein
MKSFTKRASRRTGLYSRLARLCGEMFGKVGYVRGDWALSGRFAPGRWRSIVVAKRTGSLEGIYGPFKGYSILSRNVVRATTPRAFRRRNLRPTD